MTADPTRVAAAVEALSRTRGGRRPTITPAPRCPDTPEAARAVGRVPVVFRRPR